MRMEFVGTPAATSVFPYKLEGWYRSTETAAIPAELLEDRSVGLKGLKTIDTVAGSSITVVLDDVPDVPDHSPIVPSILTNIRISTASSVERAKELYTSQASENDFYAYVILGDRDAIQSDMDKDEFKSKPGSSLKKLNVRQLFTIFLIAPTTSVSSSKVKNIIYTELFEVFLKCLHGWKDTGYVGDGQILDNTSLYGHAFDFESRMQLSYVDGYMEDDTVAFRQITSQQTVNDKGDQNAEIKL